MLTPASARPCKFEAIPRGYPSSEQRGSGAGPSVRRSLCGRRKPRLARRAHREIPRASAHHDAGGGSVVVVAPEKRSRRAISSSAPDRPLPGRLRSEEHTSELQSRPHLVCRLLLEKKKKK